MNVFEKHFRDPVSSLTHFGGMLAAIPVLVVFVVLAARSGGASQVVSLAVFGASLLLLYGASGLYHMVRSPVKRMLLRRVDHMMIYVLIAGTYTPVCLVVLPGAWGITLLTLIWALALAGIILKIFFLNAPRKLSSGLYLMMGWLVVVASYPLAKAVSVRGLAFLVGGGLAYTAGAVIYALKKPDFNNKWFGFHEVFHLFILVGSFLHVCFMFEAVL